VHSILLHCFGPAALCFVESPCPTGENETGSLGWPSWALSGSPPSELGTASPPNVTGKRTCMLFWLAACSSSDPSSTKCAFGSLKKSLSLKQGRKSWACQCAPACPRVLPTLVGGLCLICIFLEHRWLELLERELCCKNQLAVRPIFSWGPLYAAGLVGCQNL